MNFVGREITKNGLVDKKAEIEAFQKLIEDCGLHVSPKALLRNLTVAQCQLIEIIKAISVNAKVIVMDEPTTSIIDKGVHILFDHINRLKAKGIAIIYISHRMDEIFTICDRISVFRDGQYIGCGEVKDLDEPQLIKMMVGRETTDVFLKLEAKIGDVMFEAKHIVRDKKVKDISISVRSGEILGIAGLVGAGRSELMEGGTMKQKSIAKQHNISEYFIVIICGGFDMSVGSIIAFTGILAAMLGQGNLPLIVPFIVACRAGLGVGIVNGVGVAVGNLSPFIMTLGTMTAVRGLALLTSNGKTITGISEGYKKVTSLMLFGKIPMLAVFFIIVIAVCSFVLAKTVFGRRVFSCGGNLQAARVAGINTTFIRIVVFAASEEPDVHEMVQAAFAGKRLELFKENCQCDEILKAVEDALK